MFAGMPLTTIDLNIIQCDQARSTQYQVDIPGTVDGIGATGF